MSVYVRVQSTYVAPQWVDVSVPIKPGMPVFNSDAGLHENFKVLYFTV